MAPPSPAEFMLPQIALLLFNATAIVVGLTVITNAVTTGITVALCALHVLILGRVLVAALWERHRPKPQEPPAEIDLTDGRLAGREFAGVGLEGA
jgi:membrane protein implicated in regulation of membrane protease activity